MKRIAIFASGSGSNFEALINACESKEINAEVVLMVCDKKQAYVVERAKNHNVDKFVFSAKDYESKAAYEAEIVEKLNEYNVDLEGKHCVVIGRSNIVGKPIAMMLMQRNATVTICHSKTKDLEKFCKMADIIVCAVGKTDLVTDDMIKDGVVIIDVGINRNEQGKVCGDVNIQDKSKVSYMTPVPGGVGPMTITMLLQNTLILFKENLV